MEPLDLVGGVQQPSRVRALVIDDEPIARATCATILEEGGAEVTTASSGVEGLDRLRRGAFDLLLCDLVMPPPDGFAVIQATQGLPSPPAVLAITALSQGDRALEALRAGGCRVLFKPIDAIELADASAWALHTRRLADGRVTRDDLETLHRVVTATNGEPIFARAMERMLEIVLTAAGADQGSVMTLSGTSEARTLSMVASLGLRERRNDPPVPFGEGICGWVAKNRRPLRVVGPLENYPQFRGWPSNPVIAEAIVAPALWGSTVLGTLNIASRRPGVLGLDRMPLVVNVAGVAAAAIQRNFMERERQHRERIALIGQLTAEVVHELANPVVVISSFIDEVAERLSAGVPSDGQILPDMGTDLAAARASVERMSALVTSLRGISRRGTVASSLVDVNSILERCQVLMQAQFRHRIDFRLELGSPPPVMAVAEPLIQIVLNLLVNASQALGRDGRVVLRSRENAGSALVEVEDNGPGIPSDTAERLFEPFFTTKADGVGLGLSTSREMARQFGGDLSFTSELGRGTRFTLVLPGAIEPRGLRQGASQG